MTNEYAYKFRDKFLETHTLEDIKKPYDEMPYEFYVEGCTYSYGNGWLSVEPVQDEEPTAFVIDNYGQFNDVLVEY